MTNREIAGSFVVRITKEYIRNGMFDGTPEWRLTERLTRDITALLDGLEPPKKTPAKTPVFIEKAPVPGMSNSDLAQVDLEEAIAKAPPVKRKSQKSKVVYIGTKKKGARR